MKRKGDKVEGAPVTKRRCLLGPDAPAFPLETDLLYAILVPQGNPYGVDTDMVRSHMVVDSHSVGERRDYENAQGLVDLLMLSSTCRHARYFIDTVTARGILDSYLYLLKYRLDNCYRTVFNRKEMPFFSRMTKSVCHRLMDMSRQRFAVIGMAYLDRHMVWYPSSVQVNTKAWAEMAPGALTVAEEHPDFATQPFLWATLPDNDPKLHDVQYSPVVQEGVWMATCIVLGRADVSKTLIRYAADTHVGWRLFAYLYKTHNPGPMSLAINAMAKYWVRSGAVARITFTERRMNLDAILAEYDASQRSAAASGH